MNQSTMLALFLAVAAAFARPAGAAPTTQGAKPEPIKVLILVGGHGYDQKNFDKAWGGHDDIQCEVWKDAKKPFAAFDDIANWKHDAIVMYTLMGGMTPQQQANFLQLLKKGVGLVVWHHALGNCQDWPEFEKIAGGKYWMKPGEREGKQIGASGYKHGVDLKVKVQDPDHPVTKGLKDFEIHDETYNKQTFRDDIRVLVWTDHPASDKPIAWVPKYGEARIFTLQSGHDAAAWSNAGHRHLLSQGIRWVAGRL
jgi:type 1 glutamine amidotransferase